MFKNYLKTALRNLSRHKGYSFINISGFSIGIACCFLIFLWVQDELSYDRFHKNIDDLYRVVEHQMQSTGDIFPIARTQYPLGQALVDEYPEFIKFTHFSPSSRALISQGETNFFERGIAWTDPAFFEMFTFPLLQGDQKTALSSKDSILISEEMVEKYFEDFDPIGQTLTLENAIDFRVTGVFKKIPSNSHLQFDFLGNFEKLLDFTGLTREWHSNNYYTYVQLAKNTPYKDVNDKIYNFLQTIFPTDNYTKYLLQPVKDIHLYSYFQIDLGGVSTKRDKYVYMFSIIAVFVLLIACINFVNLTTARSSGRALEIGIRKVVGAHRRNLIRQFLGESLLISIFSLLTAMGLVLLLLPAFNVLSGKALSLATLNIPLLLLVLLGIILVTGILSGGYPAFLMSSIQPVKALKGAFNQGSKRSTFRKALVTLQFSLSIALILGTFVVYRQLNFIQKKNLGYSQDHVIYLSERGAFWKKYDTFKEELLQHSEILGVTAASSVPTFTVTSTTGVSWEGKDPEDKVLFTQFTVDYDYFETLDMEMEKGRSFSKKFSTDMQEAYVLNETGAAATGLQDPIGKSFALWNREGTIIGVVKDYNFKSLHTKIEPLLHRLWGRYFGHALIRVKSGDMTQSLKAVEQIYRKHNPGYPFEYHFLNEELDHLYISDQRTAKVFQTFMVLALFISSLGLFGMASFLAAQRTKEIGIRKVLGATVPGIFVLLLKEFAKWVLLANAIAWPFGYLVMDRWLKNFAYRTDIALWIFAASGILGFIIAVITVSYQSIKASIANPVDSLKYE
ncbi:ABC transporter permease [Acidobacteriota bacterium]